jgi:hypothetical protein
MVQPNTAFFHDSVEPDKGRCPLPIPFPSKGNLSGGARTATAKACVRTVGANGKSQQQVQRPRRNRELMILFREKSRRNLSMLWLKRRTTSESRRHHSSLCCFRLACLRHGAGIGATCLAENTGEGHAYESRHGHVSSRKSMEASGARCRTRLLLQKQPRVPFGRFARSKLLTTGYDSVEPVKLAHADVLVTRIFQFS